MDTNISVFQHENVVKHIHNAHKVFELLDRLFVQLEVFFHLLCRAVPLFRSALFGPYTQSILNDTQTEKEKEMVEKSRKKINSFNKQHPAQCSDLCELFAYFIRYCLFSLTRSLFKQFTVLCAHHICCVCHMPFSTSPDSWASYFVVGVVAFHFGLSARRLGYLYQCLWTALFSWKKHTSTNGKKNENKPTATTTHPQKITQISRRIPNIPKATENQFRAQISHNNCEARCVHAQWKTCVWWFLLVEFMESTHKNTMHCSACGTFVENAQATAINLGHFIYDSIIRLIANGQQ